MADRGAPQDQPLAQRQPIGFGEARFDPRAARGDSGKSLCLADPPGKLLAL
jgi:hypothetical protein